MFVRATKGWVYLKLSCVILIPKTLAARSSFRNSELMLEKDIELSYEFGTEMNLNLADLIRRPYRSLRSDPQKSYRNSNEFVNEYLYNSDNLMSTKFKRYASLDNQDSNHQLKEQGC